MFGARHSLFLDLFWNKGSTGTQWQSSINRQFFCWKTFTGELQCLGANLFCIRRHLRLVVAFTTQWWTCHCLKTTLPLKMGDLKRRGYFSKTEGCFVFELRAVAVRGPHKQLLLLMTSKLKASLQFWTSRSIKFKFMMDILIVCYCN